MVSEVRKDEQRRLYEEGNVEAAKALKKTRYILMSNRSTLQKNDALLQENKLLFTLDLVKEKLSAAYAMTDEAKMSEAIIDIIDIIDICKTTGNKHLLWFGKLLVRRSNPSVGTDTAILMMNTSS